MCYMLYIGSNSELPLISAENFKIIDLTSDSWVLNVKPLSIVALADNEKKVTDKFVEKNVVYAGSYEGCGCGYFHCMPDPDIEGNPIEVEASLRSRNALFDYIKKNNVTTIYGCWAGEEDEPALNKIEIKPEQLIDKNYEYPEKIIVKIKHEK